MFKKLLSNLPFNPSLINQVSFYAKRLKQETAVRRLGFILVSLTMVLQLFAVLSPAQPSLAQSTNDLINGGFSSQSQAVQDCTSNHQDYATILGHFGITCNSLAAGQVVTMHSTDELNNLYSMGRNPQGVVNQTTGKRTNEVTVNVNGLPYPLYMRLLSSWDKPGTTSTYTALSVGNIFGVHYYLLFSCGNVVQTGQPGTPAPTPAPKPAPKPVPIPGNPVPKPPEKCPLDTSIFITDARCKTCPYDKTILKSNAKCVQCPNPRYPNVTKSSPTCKVVCPYNISFDQESAACKPCTASQNKNDANSCLAYNKKARNLTQNIDDANNTTASPDDAIQYTLIVQNTGKVTFKGFVINEDLTDVLEYAKITDMGGSTKDGLNGIKWPAVDIAPGQIIKKQFSVQVINPVPTTPEPCNPAVVHPCPTTGTGDLTMTNVFYNHTINIKVQPPIAKTVETVSNTTLPNTGPGTSLMIGFIGTAIVGYFFARSRLMSKELDIVRAEYTTSGGM